MTLWFLVFGALRVWGIAQHPAVLWALDPRKAIEYLFSGGYTSFLVLGGVFLCATGRKRAAASGSGPIRPITRHA
jgi:KUP system potassium uptake protein